MALHHQFWSLFVANPIMGDKVVETLDIFRSVNSFILLIFVDPHQLIMPKPLVKILSPVGPRSRGEDPVGQMPGPKVSLIEDVCVLTFIRVVAGHGFSPAGGAAEHHSTAVQAGNWTLDTLQTVPTVAQSLLLVNYGHKCFLYCYQFTFKYSS